MSAHDPERPRDAFERLLAEIGNAAFTQSRTCRHASSERQISWAWLCDPLEPRRNVDAVAEDVLAISQNIAEIDADPIEDALRLGELDVALVIMAWIAIAHSTAATTEGNSSSTPSPVVLTRRPPKSRTIGVAASRRSRTSFTVPASSSPMRRE